MANGIWGAQLNLKKAFEDREIAARKVTANALKATISNVRSSQLAAPQINSNHDKNVQNSAGRISQAVAWAKAQAPSKKTTPGDTWINRSYRAARGIMPIVITDKKTIGFGIKHTIFYGAYLELGHNRKYAVIEPAIRKIAPEYVKAIREIYRG